MSAPDGGSMPAVRFDALDALRGAAMLWMAVYHFCFDLTVFGLTRQNFYHDPFWIAQRTGILSLFLFCAGFSQALALQRGQGWERFWQRWAQIAGGAALVTAGSYGMFPRSFIYFGVLHGMAVMLIIARLTAPWGRWLWGLGLLAVLMPWMVQHPVFDARLLSWIGLVTRKPVTEDFVPLLPWLGVMWWGVAAGRWALAQPHGPWSRPAPRPLRLLVPLGRWSLSFYLLHQPVLIGSLMAFLAIVR